MTDHSHYSHPRITTRQAIVVDDEDFLRELYLTTREDLAGLLTADQLRQLVAIQYAAQQRTYSEQFPTASNEIVLLDGRPVGRFLVERRADVIHIIDIALLPEVRGVGVGSILIQRLLRECRAASLPCILQVLKSNRAQRLYARLGFRVMTDDGVRYLMRWEPASDS